MSKYTILDKSHKKSMKEISTDKALNVLEHYRDIDLYVEMSKGSFYKVERLTQKMPKDMTKGDLYDPHWEYKENGYVHAIDVGGVIRPMGDIHMIQFSIKKN